MKRLMCGLTVLALMLLCLGSALAEQKVRLPESSYCLKIPDGMEYDGPGDYPDDADFAWVSEELGLDIQFFRRANDKGATLQAMADILIGDGIDASIYRINGIDMVAYRVQDPQDPPEKGMKCIGYVFLDGDAAQMICFWYAGQTAADLTAEIIGSITDKD